MRRRIDGDAFAKLNLSLTILGERDDGFHEIRSVVQTVDLADRISLIVSEGRGISVDNDLPQRQGTDLAEKAAAALLAAKQREIRVDIAIRKGIPAGSGLGGGSSDAAWVLAALNRLTPPLLDPDSLAEVAASLGSDVPLFLAGGCVEASGRGERVARRDEMCTETFVILVPPIHCNTAEVYDVYRRMAPQPEQSERFGANSLLSAALSLQPGLEMYRDAVERMHPHFGGMSGSGSAFYAAYRHRERAEDAAIQLAATCELARIFVCSATRSGQRFEIEEGAQ